MVSLFDASFGYVDRAAFEAAEAGKDLSEYEELALDAHGAQLQALTRLRFLANPEVLELAFELHDIEDRLYSIAFTEPFEPGEWQKLQDQQRDVRTKLFNACRRNLGLHETLPIVPDSKIGPSAEERVLHEISADHPVASDVDPEVSRG